jgi:hypothetical protein
MGITLSLIITLRRSYFGGTLHRIISYEMSERKIEDWTLAEDEDDSL